MAIDTLSGILWEYTARDTIFLTEIMDLIKRGGGKYKQARQRLRWSCVIIMLQVFGLFHPVMILNYKEEKMERYQLNTTLFGRIVVPVQDGLFEDFTITLGGREISTALYIMEEFLSAENSAGVTHFLEQIPAMYESAKKSLTDCCHTNGTVSFFIESSMDVDDDDYQKYLMDTFGVESIGEITKEEFIGGLQPRCIRIGPDKDANIDCVFDFSLDEDFTDQLLVVYFNEKLELTDISHES